MGAGKLDMHSTAHLASTHPPCVPRPRLCTWLLSTCLLCPPRGPRRPVPGRHAGRARRRGLELLQVGVGQGPPGGSASSSRVVSQCMSRGGARFQGVLSSLDKGRGGGGEREWALRGAMGVGMLARCSQSTRTWRSSPCRNPLACLPGQAHCPPPWPSVFFLPCHCQHPQHWPPTSAPPPPFRFPPLGPLCPCGLSACLRPSQGAAWQRHPEDHHHPRSHAGRAQPSAAHQAPGLAAQEGGRWVGGWVGPAAQAPHAASTQAPKHAHTPPWTTRCCSSAFAGASGLGTSNTHSGSRTVAEHSPPLRGPAPPPRPPRLRS